VRLTIEQEVSSIAPSTTTSTADIVTNKRSIRTNVLVEDSQIIVIGGLISDDVRQSTQKVPLLGDIPLIGNAFRNRRSDTVRTNLMVFLRPTILRDKLTAANITMSKYSYIRDLQNLAPQDRVQLLPQEPTPKLPPAPTAPLPQGELPPPVEKLHGTGANMPPPESAPKAPDSGTSSTSSLSPGSPKAFVTAGSGKAPNPTPADSRSLASTPAPTQSTVSRQRMEPALRPRILDAAR
jgi:general secretion pathway protein D